jgi:photosystem II stability/assembly factor-like uncharacterized protein
MLAPWMAKAQPTSFLTKESWSAIWNKEDEETPVDPGWVEQYYLMKKNKDGVIPRLPFENIRKHAGQAALRDNLLFNFQELGPYNIGGRTRAILVDYSNDQHVLSGSVSGGLFTTYDAGATWNVVNDEMTALSISSLAQDQFVPSLIYAGTGEGWGNADGVIGNGVYRSTDGGITFEQLPSTDDANFNYIFDIATSRADSHSLYIATGTGNLYRSFNRGDSLELVFNVGNAISDIELTPSGGVWIAVYNQGIYYSASGDSGTFATRNTGITGDRRRIEFAMAPSDTLILYAAVERSSADGLSGVFRTDDFGENWSAVVNPSDYGFYTTFTWYSMTIAVKPDDPDFVVLGVGALMYSLNGGNQWFECSGIHVDHHTITFHPENPKILYEGNDGGIYRLNTDMMYTNTNLNTGYRTVQYYAGAFYPTGLNILGGTQDNGTHKCTSGSGEFFHVLGGDGAYCAVNQQYPDLVYAEYQNGIFNRAFDGTDDVPSFFTSLGELDSDGDGDVDEGAWFINPFDINLVNGDYMGFVTTKRLWHSFDGGSGWQPAMNQISAVPYAIGISRDFSPTVYVGGSSALFYRIDNAYDSQPGDEVNLSAKVPASVSADFISSITVHPSNGGTCYVSFSSISDEPRIWKVTDANTSNPVWTSVSGDLPQGLSVNYVDVDPARPDEFFLAATDYGVYASDDAGEHWYKMNQFPNVYTQQVKVRPADRRIFVWTHGRGAFTATLDSLMVGMQQVSSSNFNPVMYPNPCSDRLYVQAEAGEFDVTIRNVSNQIVSSPLAVRQRASLDVSQLPSGIYFVEYSNGKETKLKKLIRK